MADDIMTSYEIDYFIDNFEVTKLEDVGKKRWFSKSSTIVKLYQTAALEVSLEGVERVKQTIERCGKIVYFIRELMVIFVWKEHVFPELLKLTPAPNHSLPTYIVLYNEVALVGLLQACLFHSLMFQDMDDACIDLIDYCVTNLTRANPDDVPIERDLIKDSTAIEDLQYHTGNINFLLTTHCTSLLRYVCENLENLPINVASRIYCTHDVPILISQLIDREVWCKRVDGKTYKFCDNTWREWFPKDPPLSPTEVQAWLLIRQLLLSQSCATHYQCSNYRKEHLSRLLRHLHEAVIDQLSPLTDLKYWLHTNSMSTDNDGPRVTNPLIMEVTSQYKDLIYDEYKGKWQDIAVTRSKLLFYPDKTEMQFLGKTFSDCMDNVERLEDNIKSCMNCQAKAVKRCSKCKKAPYCSRKCQVEHWSAHKNTCR